MQRASLQRRKSAEFDGKKVFDAFSCAALRKKSRNTVSEKNVLLAYNLDLKDNGPEIPRLSGTNTKHVYSFPVISIAIFFYTMIYKAAYH